MKLHKNKILSIRRKLDRLYEEFAFEENLSKDPLGALDRGLSSSDLEISSFIIAGLSYGRVEQILQSFENYGACLPELGLTKNGEGLSEYLKTTSPAVVKSETNRAFKKWKHRLNTGRDLSDLFVSLSHNLQANDSLENLFSNNATDCFSEKLSSFSTELCKHAPIRKKTSTWKGTGASWFFANPRDGSTCKRMLMWTRWMIRSDEVDLGLWRNSNLISELLWPVDTHIHKWALHEKLTDRKTVSWKFCTELSDVAKQINFEDPIKYDFSICQAGMKAFRGK